VGYMDPPTMWRATTVQACGMWPFAAGSGSPMTTVGRTLVVYLCAFLVVSAIVFLASFPRLWRGALGQGVPSAAALLAAALS
ncbi:hypothetical protein ACWEWQ_39575, partial [Streptomyces sp. NPDC003832]